MNIYLPGECGLLLNNLKKSGSAIYTLTLELFKVHMSLAREMRSNGGLKYRSRIQCKAFSGWVGGDDYIASLLLGIPSV
jgi:hypothetical protein